jgi:HK97 family phage major capsid protein
MYKRKQHVAQLERKDDSGAGGGGQVLELKSLVQKIGQAFEEFKKTNDELLKAKADGKAIADIEAKLSKIDKDVSEFTEAKEAIEKLMVKMNRPGFGGSGDQEEKLAAEVKTFNAYRKSWTTTHVADVTTEQYVAYKSAFFNLVRTGNPDRLSDDERKAMMVGSDSDGGYLMPTPTVGRIVQRVFETSPIRQIASVMTISTDALEGINDNDEADAGWVGETGTRNDTDTPQVGKYRIEAAEMYAQPKATQKLLDDAAVDVESWLGTKVADKFTRVENAAFVVGDGVAKPRGFTAYPTAATADATRAWGTLEHIVTGANADFGATTPADKLHDLVGAFKDAYLQNGRWVTRREVMTKVRKFKDGQNQYLWQPGLQAGQPQQLLGYPVTIAQDMPALTAGSLSMAFGDFREGYQIVDRIGIRVLRDPYTAKPYVKFYTTKRTGGGVLNYEAIKFLKFST